jgi:Bacterial protein of unknown function (Gcw_chp)
MKKSVCTAALFLVPAAVSSLADDSERQTTPWDIAFDAAPMSDYDFTGISQLIVPDINGVPAGMSFWDTANLTIFGPADDRDKQAKEDRERAEKKAKEDREKAEKKAKEEMEKAQKKAQEPWDMAFGTALLSNYNFRGISASDHRPAVSVYFEPHYDFSSSLQAYVHVETNSLTFPTYEAPAVELFAGVRPTFDRLALDFGFWEHWLPAGRCFNFAAPGGLCIPQLTIPYVNSLPADISFPEVFGKAAYTVDRQLSLGGGVYWTPSVMNSGADATYVAGWAKYVLPPIFPKDFGWFISAEAGHWFRDTSPFPSYTNWNAGLAFAWKQFTLDLRYSDTDRHDCAVPVAALEHTSNRCGASFVATFAVDLTKANLTSPAEKPTTRPY